MAVLFGNIGHYYPCRLNVWRLKVSKQAVTVTCRGWDAVVTNEWLSENKDLATVRRVGHGFRIAHE